ncbi:MAG: metallopeptidase TldD-related protein [Novosphingobium sp.]
MTGLHGGSTDPASGNWTRAVNGLWVEDGAVVHPVTDVTLAGSMPAMLKGIVAIGSDVERQGAIRTGPILIDEMQIGGSA